MITDTLHSVIETLSMFSKVTQTFLEYKNMCVRAYLVLQSPHGWVAIGRSVFTAF